MNSNFLQESLIKTNPQKTVVHFLDSWGNKFLKMLPALSQNFTSRSPYPVTTGPSSSTSLERKSQNITFHAERQHTLPLKTAMFCFVFEPKFSEEMCFILSLKLFCSFFFKSKCFVPFQMYLLTDWHEVFVNRYIYQIICCIYLFKLI